MMLGSFPLIRIRMHFFSDNRLPICFAVLLFTVLSYVPYMRGIATGASKPHAFTWCTWGILATIAFFAQFFNHGGEGSAITGITALFSFFIAVCAVGFGPRDIKAIDWLCFFLALCAIPLWIVHGSPEWALILVLIVDALLVVPTINNSYAITRGEKFWPYYFVVIKYGLALLILEEYSFITVAYPAFQVLSRALLATATVVRYPKSVSTVEQGT